MVTGTQSLPRFRLPEEIKPYVLLVLYCVECIESIKYRVQNPNYISEGGFLDLDRVQVQVTSHTAGFLDRVQVLSTKHN